MDCCEDTDIFLGAGGTGLVTNLLDESKEEAVLERGGREGVAGLPLLDLVGFITANAPMAGLDD